MPPSKTDSPGFTRTRKTLISISATAADLAPSANELPPPLTHPLPPPAAWSNS